MPEPPQRPARPSFADEVRRPAPPMPGRPERVERPERIERAERIDPLGIVSPSVDLLRDLARDYAGVNVLGFHPLELLRKLLERER